MIFSVKPRMLDDKVSLLEDKMMSMEKWMDGWESKEEEMVATIGLFGQN